MIRTPMIRHGFVPGLLFGLLGLCGSSSAQDSFQIRAQAIVRADGSRLENGVLLVENGKVAGLGTRLADGVPTIEHDGVLTPGLVVCQTMSGMGGEANDQTRSLLPEARLVHAYDPTHSDFEKALAAGITTMVLPPDGRNVAGGLTAVVKTEGTVVSPGAHVALSFSEKALAVNTGFFFSFFGAVEDGDIEDTSSSASGTRTPTSYAGIVAELDEHFSRAEGVFARAKAGQVPVYLEAWERHEVLRALAFAKRHGLRGALRGAPRASDPAVLRAFRGSGFGCVMGPFDLGQPRASLESFVSLSAAGVPVAFGLDAPGHSPLGLRVSAAMALSAGAKPASVSRALTIDAARLAGVEGRVGSLEPGKDADFCLWSGEPWNLTSRLDAVYIDGQLAHDNE